MTKTEHIQEETSKEDKGIKMKKLISTLAILSILCGAAYATGVMDGIKSDFDNFKNSMFRDKSAVTTNQKNRNGYDDSVRIEDEIAAINAKRDKELEPVNKQIEEKNALYKKTMIDTNLTLSQKKAKMTLIQKDINTLKAQKTNIEAKYAQQVKDTRAIY